MARGKTMTKPSKLPKFQGRDVNEMTGAFRKAGDGLSDKMQFDPTPHEAGDEVFHILRSIVGGINHKPTALLINAPFVRVEDYVVQEAVEVDGEDIKAYLEQAKAAINAAKEAEAIERGDGVTRTLEQGHDEPVKA